MELPLVPSDSSSLLSSLSSSIEQSKKFFSENSSVLETFAKQLIDPNEIESSQKYAVKLAELSQETVDEITRVTQSLNLNPLAIRQEETVFSQPSATDFNFDASGLQKLLSKDKQKAQQLIQNLVQKAREVKQELLKDLANKPIHPYEQMIQDYLGRKFKPKPVEEMDIDRDLDPQKVLLHINELSRQLHENSMVKATMMFKEAMDTSFPGITSEALGTAFGVLSGNVFVVDKEMTKRHLEFVENIRAIPIENFVIRPYETAKRILSEFGRTNYTFQAVR